MSILGEGVNAVVWVSSGVGLVCCVAAVVVCLSVSVWDFVRSVRVLPPTPGCATIRAH